MKKFKDDGRPLERFPCNTFDQAPDDVPVIVYRRAEGGRSHTVNRCVVWMRNKKINPSGAWYDSGNKVFVGKRIKSLPLAQAWCAEHYGVTEWQRNGDGQWLPEHVPLLPLRRQIEKQRAKTIGVV